jgi:hypothetical protein
VLKLLVFHFYGRPSAGYCSFAQLESKESFGKMKVLQITYYELLRCYTV